MKKCIPAALLIALGWVLSASGRAEEVCLVRKGTPLAALVLPVQADDDEGLAANELQAHIEVMSGARLEIAYGAPPRGFLPVYIGEALNQRTADGLKERSGD
ncbi:MAG TPA: hypothetical protein VMX75_04025, partial [Spirochaetia bacterium]|nr:hypothetical protein [Spirochaetia bacterium]